MSHAIADFRSPIRVVPRRPEDFHKCDLVRLACGDLLEALADFSARRLQPGDRDEARLCPGPRQPGPRPPGAGRPRRRPRRVRPGSRARCGGGHVLARRLIANREPGGRPGRSRLAPARSRARCPRGRPRTGAVFRFRTSLIQGADGDEYDTGARAEGATRAGPRGAAGGPPPAGDRVGGAGGPPGPVHDPVDQPRQRQLRDLRRARPRPSPARPTPCWPGRSPTRRSSPGRTSSGTSAS